MLEWQCSSKRGYPGSAPTTQVLSDTQDEPSPCLGGHVLGAGHSLYTWWYKNHSQWEVWSPVFYSLVCRGEIAGDQ